MQGAAAPPAEPPGVRPPLSAHQECRVSAAREQSLHSQPEPEPNANKSMRGVLETYFPVFYLGFHCLCTWVNGTNSSSIHTG